MATERILDASVIVSLVVTEDDSDWAIATVGKYQSLGTLELAYHEVTSAMRSKISKRDLQKDDAEKALADALDLMGDIETHAAKDLATESFNISLEFGVSTYDASYIALAKKQHSKLITLDRKLAKKLENSQYHSLLEYPE